MDDVQRAPGARGSVRVAVENGDTFVYPDEAMPYIANGRLDKQLFDVTQLVAQGYDDARTGALPLIVTQSEGATARKSGAAKDALPSGTTLPGAKATRGLASVNGAAVKAQRSKAATFWSALTDPPGRTPSGRRHGRLVARTTRRPRVRRRCRQGVARRQGEGDPGRHHRADRRAGGVGGRWHG